MRRRPETLATLLPLLLALLGSPLVHAQTPAVEAEATCSATAPATPAGFYLKDHDRVVFYGDSITQDGRYGRFVEEYVATRFPAWSLRFYNAGVGGDTVRGGRAGEIALRLERDVLAQKPTVVTVMLGMNDGGYKPFDAATFTRYAEGYRAIVEKLKEALPGARLTLLRTSPFDDVARPPQFPGGYDDVLRRYGCFVAGLALREGALPVDFREPVNAGVAAVFKADPDLARLVIPDRVHPSAAGHMVMGAALLRAWGAPGLVTRVEIDAPGRKVAAAENTDVTGLEATGGGLAWTQLDRALPLPLAFDNAEVDLANRAGADIAALDQEPLRVTGLPPGRYDLKIDAQGIGTFTEAELAKGVDLAAFNTPMRWQAFPISWTAEARYEMQRLRREMLVDAPSDPKVQETAEALAARDEAAQRARSETARPRPRKYEIVPHP